MESFNTFLKQFPHYTPSAFEIALPYLSEESVKPGEYLIKEGRIARSIAFIESGLT